jgi:hypothetical protein
VKKEQSGPLDTKRETPKPTTDPKFIKGVATPDTKK